MIRKFINGAVGGFVKPVAGVFEAREVTKQIKEKGLALAQVAAAAWRPWLAKLLGTSVLIHVLGSVAMMYMQMRGAVKGEPWHSLVDVHWDQWMAYGAMLFDLSWKLLGLYIGSRGTEKIGSLIGGRTGNAMQTVAGVVTGNKPVTVDREISRVDVDAEVGDIEGVEVRYRDKASVPTSVAPVVPVSYTSGERRRVSSSRHFKQHKLECRCDEPDCVYPGMDAELMEIADHVRDVFGPCVSNSAYRCPVHNKREGGAVRENGKRGSYHLDGRAIDIRPLKVSPQQLFDYLNNKFPKQYGIGLYNTMVHFDTRTDGWARKTGPNQNWRAFKQELHA